MTPDQGRRGRLPRGARRLLTVTVRGRQERGGQWGEALLAEFDQTGGTAEVLRWTVGGLRVAWRERRTARRARFRALSRTARLGWRVAYAVPIAAATLLLGQAFVATVSYQASGSMAPTVAVADRVVIDRASFHLTGLRHGDIVLVRRPGAGHGEPNIRRVLGLPGDRISCEGGALYRDGAPVAEGYLPAGTRTDCAATTVARGQLYLLGDNRANALDSRQLGTVASSLVVGRALTVIPGDW